MTYRSHRGRSALLIAAMALFAAVPAQPAAAGQMAGVNAHLTWAGVSAAEQERQLERMAAAGAGITRVDVGWSSLEQDAKGDYSRWHLDRLDGLVAAAERHGVKLLLTLTDSPCWASSAPESRKQGCEGAWWERSVQRYPPANPRDYADALAFVVRRYGDRVAAWEIWNEPNDSAYFKSDNPAPAYAQIVRAAYPAAKAADPAPTIIAGALANAPAEFVEELMQHGIGGHFDAFSVHPYAGDASPLDPLDDRWIMSSFARGVPSVRATLLRHGEDKPIWLTEFGWSTSTIRGQEPWRNGVDEQTQARYTEQALVKVRDWPYVPAAIVFELLDERDDRDSRNSNFGLMRHDGTPKPAYAAFRRGAEALAGDGRVRADGGPQPVGADAEPQPAEEVRQPERAEAEAPPPLSVRVVRRRSRLYARGVAAPRTVVRVRAYRYLRKKRRFARRAGYVARVRVRRSGRFAHRLGRRLGRGRWRVVATYPRRSNPSRAARTTVRGGRPA